MISEQKASAKPADDPHSLPPRLYALLAGLTLGWGLNWPVMKIALAEIPVWSFRAFCVLSGAAGIALIARAAGQRLWPHPAEWRMLLLTAVFNVTLWNICIGFGLMLLPAGRSAILAYTMPLWTVLLSAIFLGEHLTRRRVTGLLCGAGALVLLLWEEAEALRAAPFGTLLVVSGALAWAAGTILMKRMPSSMPTSSFTAWQFLLGGLPLLAGAALFDHASLQAVSASAAGAVFYNVAVSFIFCHWAWFRIVQQAPAGVAALSTMLIPVIGVLSSLLVLGDRPAPTEILALLLVLASLATVLNRTPQASRPND